MSGTDLKLFTQYSVDRPTWCQELQYLSVYGPIVIDSQGIRITTDTHTDLQAVMALPTLLDVGIKVSYNL